MPSAMQKIATITASGSSSALEFTTFPATYTDLIIKVNVRSGRSSGPVQDSILVRFNSVSSGTSYAHQIMYSDASAFQGDSVNPTSSILAGYVPTANSTANTYSNGEIYISDYAVTTHNKAVKTNIVDENDGTQAYMAYSAGEFLSTNAITTISLLTGSGQNWVAGSTATLYGITKASAGGTGSKAIGGTVTTAGGYTYHTFLTSGVFTPTTNISGAEVLAIAGGGGSGAGAAGGGGAGGVVYASSQSFTSGVNYTAIVGSGGRCADANVANNGTNGSPSRFGSGTVAVGGGGGGYPGNGQSGGSGGGAHRNNTAGTGTVGQGNAGGIGTASGGSNSGGGGGAGEAGQNAVWDGAQVRNGRGGNGTNAYTAWGAATNTGQLVWTEYYYAGGGGGHSSGGNVGGYGGGGGVSGSPSDSRQAGWPNTGGGGGADGSGRYGNGGSGIVIVRYTT